MLERQEGDASAHVAGRVDELEQARRVYGVFVAEAAVGLGWNQRIAQVGPLMALPAAKVRRLLALHMAPPRIQELFLEGKLAARQVECLQALPEDNQVIVARQLVAAREKVSHMTTVASVSSELDQSWGQPRRDWSDPAAEFEAALIRSGETLDDYLDMPQGALRDVFRGAGTELGRRRIITLIEEQIELLTAMKRALERAKGGLHATHAAATTR